MWKRHGPWVLRGQPVRDIKGFVDEVASRDAPDPALIPSTSDIATLLDTALWASTVADEGRYPRFSLVFCPPVEGTLRFEERPLAAKTISALSPALVSGLTRIGIYRSSAGGLRIWGLMPGTTSCFEVLGIAPAHIVVRMRPWNVAVFRRNEYVSLARRDPDTGIHGLGREHFVASVRGAFTTTLKEPRRTLTAILILMMAATMRSQGNGGTLLILPEDPDHKRVALDWLQDGPNRIGGIGLEACFEVYEPRLTGTGDPLTRALSIPEIGNYLLLKPGVGRDLIEPAAATGQLSAIDGAVVLTERLELLSFGTMIRAPLSGTAAPIDTIHRRSLLHYGDPAMTGEDVKFGEVGGARRQNAARFVAYNYDTVAITASHDGPVTIAFWVAGEPHGPRAHLITDTETLLD